MTDGTMAQQIASFAIASTYASLPEDVKDSVRLRILDTLGVALAATSLDTSRAAAGWARSQGSQGSGTAIGVPTGCAPGVAAFVNGVLAHSLDFDDTHLPSVLHPSATIIPSALAVAESTGSSGADVVTAVAVGLEVCVRLGMAGYDPKLQTSLFFRHGQHATSICGALGAAVAAGLLRRFDERALTDVLGLASSMASGIIESNRGGGTVKRMHCGWAAHCAVSAAELVELGFTGPPTVLEGRFGFFEAWLHGEYFPEAVLDELGRGWQVPRICFKPYPANHFTHAIVDAALELRSRGLHTGDVERVDVHVARQVIPTIGDPIERKRAPMTAYQAQFSGPYAFAAGLLADGNPLGVGLGDYTDALAQDPARRELMSRVNIAADETCSALFPNAFPAIVEVHTKSAGRLRSAVMESRGGPGRPLSPDSVAAKFRDNASRVLARDQVRRLESAVETLDRIEDITGILAPLRGLAVVP